MMETLGENFKPTVTEKCEFEYRDESKILFFARYVICKKNYSFSRVVFLFFSPKLPTLFIEK